VVGGWNEGEAVQCIEEWAWNLVVHGSPLHVAGNALNLFLFER
jgi:hypothetical protein